jgi:ribonuclease BN (tRNA processing enzyme)
LRVTFAGVGEAFDETLANTSLLVESGTGSILLDCGFTAPPSFWGLAGRPLDLDGVYLSHFHGDHWFGLPALLVRSLEEGRTRPLTILGQPGVEDKVLSLMELAYAGTLAKARFDLRFVECGPGREVALAGFRLTFARGDHSVPCLAVRVESGGKSLFFSGDGPPTEATRALARGCTLAVHETFSLDPVKPAHGTMDSSLAFARETGVEMLALVHVNRRVRREEREAILARIKNFSACKVWLPEPGERISL